MQSDLEFERLLIGVDRACDLLDLGKTSIYALIKSGELRPTKIGTRTVFSYAEVRRFADSILAQRDADTEADKRSAEAKRRRAFRQPNTQPQSQW